MRAFLLARVKKNLARETKSVVHGVYRKWGMFRGGSFAFIAHGVAIAKLLRRFGNGAL